MPEKREYQATIVECSVDVQVKKREGGTYPGALLAYRSNGQIQEKGLHQDVYNKIRPHLKPKLLALKHGDTKYLSMEKPDGKTFWELMDITDESTAAAPSTSTASGGSTSSTSTGRSNRYDNDSPSLPINVTSQRSYARNQALTCAIEFFNKLSPNTDSTVGTVLDIAKVFEGYITGDTDKAEADQGIG